MQEKIELVRFRTFSEIIEDSILFFKQNWKTLVKAYFIICGFFWLAGLVTAVINQLQTVQRIQDGESRYGMYYFLSLIFDLLSFTTLTLTVLSFITLYKEKGNEAPTVEEIWGYVKYYFLRIFGSSLVLSLGLIVGLLCCILPMFYLWVVFSLILPIIVIENSTLGYAFNRSFQLIKNNWWSTFGVLIVTYIIIATALLAVAVPVGVIAFATSLISTASTLQVSSLTFIIVSHAFQFVYMLPAITVTLVYFSLTEQKDDVSLLARIQMLGKKNTDHNPLPTEEY